MNERSYKQWFINSVMLILLLTAFMKVASLAQHSLVLIPSPKTSYYSMPAPFLPHLSNRVMMLIEIGFELAVVGLLMRLKPMEKKLALVAWVGGLFCAYHIGLHIIGYRLPCGCLGGPTDWLRLPRRTADMSIRIMITYFLTGSYGFLLQSAAREYLDRLKASVIEQR